MKRLTECDKQGNWCLKGLPWEDLHEGQPMKKNTWEKVYGALCKLKDYENTDLSPEEVVRLDEFEDSNGQKWLLEIAKHRWNPIEERLPSDDRYILRSFDNFSLPAVGRYEDGAFYLGDCDEQDTCVSNDLYVNAWMELPKAYRPEEK